MTTDKRAQDILAKYKKARNKKQAREVIMKELDAYDRNQQWDLQNAPEWLPKPVTNFVHLVKYTKRAALLWRIRQANFVRYLRQVVIVWTS
jgi:hypothetical protein